MCVRARVPVCSFVCVHVRVCAWTLCPLKVWTMQQVYVRACKWELSARVQMSIV